MQYYQNQSPFTALTQNVMCFFKILIFFSTRVPGSIDLSPPSETPSTPSYVRWRESITYLLDDDEGKELYSAYLAQQKLGHLLSFW